MPRLANRILPAARRTPRVTERPAASTPRRSARLAPPALMPPGAGFTIPRLEFVDLKPVPAEYRIIQGERAAAQLALNLLDAGVLSGEDWGSSQGDPLTFLHQGLERWLDSNGREQIRQQFFLDVVLSTSLDRFSYRSEPCEENLATVFLTIEPDSAGYVVLGPTLRLLDQVHPRLPATFLHLFLGALNRWTRVYDYRDALDRLERMREWYEGDPEAEQMELPNVDAAIPESARRRPLGSRALETVLDGCRSRQVQALVRKAEELGRASRSAERPVVSDEQRGSLMDCAEPVPALVAVFEERDAIEGAFDEEAQGMLEVTPEPNLIIPFDGKRVASVASAFDCLAALCRTLTRASELISLMPGNRRGGNE